MASPHTRGMNRNDQRADVDCPARRPRRQRQHSRRRRVVRPRRRRPPPPCSSPPPAPCSCPPRHRHRERLRVPFGHRRRGRDQNRQRLVVHDAPHRRRRPQRHPRPAGSRPTVSAQRHSITLCAVAQVPYLQDARQTDGVLAPDPGGPPVEGSTENWTQMARNLFRAIHLPDPRSGRSRRRPRRRVVLDRHRLALATLSVTVSVWPSLPTL